MVPYLYYKHLIFICMLLLFKDNEYANYDIDIGID